MNSFHDMGGMHGFGEIPPHEADEPVFHHQWEAHAMALSRAMLVGFHFNQAEFRYVKEKMKPGDYLGLGYYERWLEGAITLLVEKGVIGKAEFAARLDEIKGERE
jgi:nitrile hydratase